MSASSTPLRPRRRLLLPSLVAIGALAGALSTLAGGAGLGLGGFDQTAAPGGRAAASPALGALPAADAHRAGALTSAAAGPWTDPSGGAAAGAARGPAVDAHPYAPGGDDLLPSGEPGPDRPAAPLRQAGSSPSPLPAPVLWLDPPRASLGQRVVLHLAAADAKRCQGRGALAGVALTGVRTELWATAAGQHRLTVVCNSAAGPAEASVDLTVPLLVAATSGENRRARDVQTARLPDLRSLGLRPLGGADDHSADLLALGDFLQQGRQSLFALAIGRDGLALAHVLARDAQGLWVDRSAELLDEGQRAVCPTAAQLISVDFNRDGRPDVWVVCSGSRQLLFLSQPDGRYRRIETAFDLQARQAEARDVDGDGWADIVLLDQWAGQPRILLLLGQGDGRFVAGPAEAWGLALPAQRR